MYVLLDVSFYLCYLGRLIKPVVTSKALFHVWLSGFHFEDVWKAPILTEDVYPRPVRYNIFYMGVRVGISELQTELLLKIYKKRSLAI